MLQSTPLYWTVTQNSTGQFKIRKGLKIKQQFIILQGSNRNKLQNGLTGLIICDTCRIVSELPLSIECVGWRHHSSLIFLILLFTKPNIEVSGWLFQTKTHFTQIVYQPFSRVSPPSFTLYVQNRKCVN